MIELGPFENCVCRSNGVPDKLCNSDLSLHEKGKKVRLSLKQGEEARALVIDQCVCKDNRLKCDGLFLYRRKNKHWMIMVELKGGNIEHAFKQLDYMRNHRAEYKKIEQLFMAEQIGNLHHSAFIVSNFMISTVAQQRMEQENSIRVKKILHSAASKTIPDIREYL